MTKVGYFLSSEEHAPRELIRQARLAEQAGFEALWISDHFHPWLDEQGQSSFVWSVIGALSQATSLPITTAVTCPLVRTHPVVIAQAAATSATLTDFTLGIGTGEALNEHIVGSAWPPAEERPFHSGGGSGKPAQGGLKVCWAPDAAQARKTAYRLWPNDQLPGEAAQLLPLPRHFGQLAELVTEEAVGRNVPCGPDPQTHLGALQAYLDAGYDEVYVNQIGPDQDGFFSFYAEQVLPELKDRG